MSDPSQPPPLEEATAVCALDLSGSGAGADFSALPAGPGVVVLSAPDGRAVLIATSANARELVRGKLAEPGAGKPGWRVDYRALAARVEVYPVGSALEGEAVYLAKARERLPESYRVVVERWRAWFAHVDPDSARPEWTKTNLIGLVKTRSAGRGRTGVVEEGVLLGPLPDKDSAGRFIEAITDAFDLCRYHHLLVQAPGATACAYKEMGRCPAPCDGSESMDAYRARTREAVAVVSDGRAAAAADALEASVREASTGREFEQAGSLMRRAERVRALARPAFSRVRRLDGWRDLILLPARDDGAVTAVVFDRGRLLRLGELRADDLDSLTNVARRVGQLPAFELTIDAKTTDTIAVYSRWLARPAKKRRGVVMRLEGDTSDLRGSLIKAASTLAKRRTGEAEPLDLEVEPIG